MSEVTLGLVLPPFDEPARLYAAARAAEHYGLHAVWVSDRTLSDWPWLDCFAVLGGVVAATERVQVGTCALIAARRNPVLTAKTLATLDYLSGGRLILGLGLAGLEPKEYEIVGVPLNRRGRITDEYIDLFRRLWSESHVTHGGEFYQCQGVTIEPKPVRPGGIPIWVGSESTRSERPLRRAAERGNGWLPCFLSPEMYATSWAQIQRYAEAAGRSPQEITPAYYAFASIGSTYEAACGVLAPAIEAIFHAPFAKFEPLCVVGTAQQWVEKIACFAAAGARHVATLLYTRDILGDIQRIGEEVVPHLRSIGRREASLV